MNILVIGSAVQDRTVYKDKLPINDDINEYDHIATGGCAFNVAYVLSKLGINSSLVATLGTDDVAKNIKEDLKNIGIDTSFVSVKEGKSGYSVCYVDKKGERIFFDYDGVNKEVESTHLTVENIKNFDAVYIAGYELIDRKSADNILSAVQIMKEHHISIYFDPSPVVGDINQNVLQSILLNTDYLILNQEEAYIMTNESYTEKSSQILLDTGVNHVIIKLGKHGAYYLSENKHIYQNSNIVEAIDTNGAGDSFLAGFLAGKNYGYSDESALKIAVNTASITVATVGSLPKDISFRKVIPFEDKILGSILGITIGDAMGMPTSMMTPTEIEDTYGYVTDFVKPIKGHDIHDGLEIGASTDDTMLAMQVVDELIEHNGIITPKGIAKKLVTWAKEYDMINIPVIGPSTRSSLEGLMAGKPIEQTGIKGVTNGAAMKIAPIGLVNYDNLPLLEENVYFACLPSHNTSIAISGAMAIAYAVASAMRNESINQIIQMGIKGARIGKKKGVKIDGLDIAIKIKKAIDICQQAPSKKAAMKAIYEQIGTSMQTTDSVPAAFGIFYLAKGNVKEAITIAANIGDDCDTIASMAGAIAGAYSGTYLFPKHWIEKAYDNQEANIKSRLIRLMNTK